MVGITVRASRSVTDGQELPGTYRYPLLPCLSRHTFTCSLTLLQSSIRLLLSLKLSYDKSLNLTTLQGLLLRH